MWWRNAFRFLLLFFSLVVLFYKLLVHAIVERLCRELESQETYKGGLTASAELARQFLKFLILPGLSALAVPLNRRAAKQRLFRKQRCAGDTIAKGLFASVMEVTNASIVEHEMRSLM